MNEQTKQASSKAVKQAMPAPLNKTQSSLAEAASLNFWTFRNHVGKRLMTQTLPGPIQKQIVKRLAEMKEKGVKSTGKAEDGVRFIVDLFGPKQKEFKDACIAPGAAIHTHSDLNTFSLKEKDPTRVIYVMRSIEFESESDELIKRRLESVHEFSKNYDAYCDIGRRACDSNFPFNVTVGGQSVRVSSLLKYPTKQEFIDSFYAYRSEFKPLALFDSSKFSHLPVEFVERHAAKANAQLVAEMDQVKDRALESVKISMDLIAHQLTKGEKIYATLRDKALAACRNLREIADGYNNSQMLRALADTIEERILKQSVAWDVFKEDDKAKATAARAAAAVSKKLGQLGQPKTVKAVTKPATAKVATKGKSAAGGLLARKKAKKAKEAASQ